MRQFENFEEMLREGAAEYPEGPCLLYEEEQKKVTMTYREFCEKVEEQVQFYRRNSWHCLGLCAACTPEWIVNFFAAAIAGLRVVLIDPALGTEQTESIMHQCEIDWFLCDDPDKAKAMHGIRIQNLQEHAGKGAVDCSGCILIYTSGTTAFGKAVVLSQKALCTSAFIGNETMPCYPGDVVLSILPLYHVFGLVCALLWPLSQGGAVALGRGLREMVYDPAYFGATIIPSVPSVLKFFQQMGMEDERLRAILIGAGPAQEDVLEFYREKGIEVRFGYGLTETASGVAINEKDGEDIQALYMCPGMEARIAEDGELLVRTPTMMNGYYHMPEETKKVLVNGELKTGDLAHFDEKGMLHIDRRKNDVLVLTNGQKVFCSEWEKQLARLLDTQVALTTRDDRLVLVVLASTAFEREIRDKVDEFNRQQHFGLQISEVILRDEPFPRTLTGKIKRYLL